LFTVDTPKKQTPRQLQPVRTMSNLSILLKDKSQTGWKLVHPWWTNQWLGVHWSSEAGNESSQAFWREANT